MAETGLKALESEIPHVIILVILVVVLLVVLTKFGWIHCSQIPGNWCDVYCNQIMRTHSKVAIISGDSGIGDPDALENIIRRTRVYTYIVPFPLSEASAGLLKEYDLIILERAKRITFKQATAVREYAEKGGAIVWIGDSASLFYADEVDIAEAVRGIMDSLRKKGVFEQIMLSLQGKGPKIVQTTELGFIDISKIPANATEEDVKKFIEDEYARKKVGEDINASRGFGSLNRIVGATYVETKNASADIELKVVDFENMMMRGLLGRFPVQAKEFAVVKEDASRVSKLAVLSVNGTDYPAILESRYAGKVVYVSFPLETVNSTTLLTNMLDYLIPC